MYNKAFTNGELAAAHNMALIFKTKNDPTNMLKWFKICIDHQDGDAAYELAVCYEYGICVDQDLKKAKHFYNFAISSTSTTEFSDDLAHKSIQRINTQ